MALNPIATERFKSRGLGVKFEAQAKAWLNVAGGSFRTFAKVYPGLRAKTLESWATQNRRVGLDQTNEARPEQGTVADRECQALMGRLRSLTRFLTKYNDEKLKLGRPRQDNVVRNNDWRR